MQELQKMWVESLSWEDPLEKAMAICCSSCLGNPMDRKAWRAKVYGVPKVSDATKNNNNNKNLYTKIYKILRIGRGDK